MIVTRGLSLSVILTLATICPAGQKRPVGAVVEHFSGSVILKENGKQVRLKEKVDDARRLYIGDSVYCEKGAKLTLWVGGKPVQLDEYSGWYVIRRPVSPEVQKALNAYGGTGGRDRAGFTIPILYSPANESSVVPGRFVLRWAPLGQSCVVSFVIRESGGRELWRQEGIDGASGLLSPDAARQALVRYREKNLSAVLQLKLTATCGDEDQVTFTLVSAASEKSLDAELMAWGGNTNDLITHLGRASVFVDYEMFPEAADEYEAALRLAPDSHDLLNRTIDAERRIGNRARAKALQAHLSQNK
jgi:hypothetical protein